MTPGKPEEELSQMLRKEREKLEVHPLDWQDEFGPLRFSDFTEFVMHMQKIERCERDLGAQKQHELCVAFGYRDRIHFERVHATFLKYYGYQNGGSDLGSFAWQEPGFSQAIMGAMALEREKEAEATLASNPALAAPEEGLTLDHYASLCSQVATRQPGVPELQKMLAPFSMDVPKWERVNKAWYTRMQSDATGTLNQLFTKAYMAAGTGQFGAAAQSTAAAMGGANQAPAGAEPMSLAAYAELGVEMGVWGKQGRDVNAMMLQKYRMTGGDLSNVSVYWGQRFQADVTLLGEYGRLQDIAKKKHEEPDPDADLKF